VREYITPNWHAIIVHAPLGLLGVGIIMELLGLLLWRRSTARVAARWMIAIGAVTAIPALTTGIYAYYDAVNPVTSSRNQESVSFDTAWWKLRDNAPENVFAEPKVKGDQSAAELLRHHIWRNSIATGVMILVVMVWIATSDRWRKTLYPLLLILLVGAQGLMILGTHEGGLAVYKHGVAQEPANAADDSAGNPSREEVIMAYVPPGQLHVTMAGWLLALALVAMAMSLRGTWHGRNGADEEQAWYGSGEGAEVAAAGVSPDVPAMGQFQVSPDVLGHVSTTTGAATPGSSSSAAAAPAANLRVPASRFWLLAFLCAAIAIASGWWIMGFWANAHKGEFLTGQFMRTGAQKATERQQLHAWFGAAIVLFTLLLALVTLVARRARWVISAIALMLLLAIAAELWLGILLMFDGHSGDYKGFKVKKSKSEARLVVPTAPDWM
jgi:uncharacterized membrane protein